MKTDNTIFARQNVIAVLKDNKCIKKTGNEVICQQKTGMIHYDINLPKLSKTLWEQRKSKLQATGVKMITTDAKDLYALCQKANEPYEKYEPQKDIGNGFILYCRSYTDEEMKQLQTAHIKASSDGFYMSFKGQDYLAPFLANALPEVDLRWTNYLDDFIVYDGWSQNGKFG